MFIRHFQKIKISIYSNPPVLRLFSLLPPVIRYKTWNYLFQRDKNNIQIVNKLCLSIIKLYDKKTACEWLEDNSEIIKSIPYPNADDVEHYDRIHAIEIHPGKYVATVSLDFNNYDSMICYMPKFVIIGHPLMNRERCIKILKKRKSIISKR